MSSSLFKIMLVLLFVASILQKSVGMIVEGEVGCEEWCVADEQTPDEELQKALDWACGKGGANCSKIQVNQPCFLPNTVKDHASYAFNNYYQHLKKKGATCYFNSAAMITALDPSRGRCRFEFIA